jgi:hypothetical protein
MQRALAAHSIWPLLAQGLMSQTGGITSVRHVH